jgi:hypothetical protein
VGQAIVTSVVEADNRQTLLFLPVSVMQHVPKGHLVEFEEAEMDVLRMTFHTPTSRADNQRYRNTRNNTGACWTSIPRRWLQNNGAQPGDECVLEVDPGQQGAYLLRLISKA